MKEKNLIILLLAITAGIVFTLFVLSIVYISKTFVNSIQISSRDTVELTDKSPFEQKIESHTNNLNLILVHLKNFQTYNQKPLNFNLLDQTGANVRDLTISGSNIRADDWVRFQFLPIVDSEEKTYTIRLFSDTPENQNRIQVVVNKGILAYKAYSVVSFSAAASKSLSNFWLRFSTDLQFDIFYGIVFIILTGLLLKGVLLKRT